MEPAKKRLTLALWGLVGIGVAGILVGKIVLPRHEDVSNSAGGELTALSQSAHDQDHPPLTALFPAPDIRLTDEDGRPFSTGSLHGRPWIADFIFTTCANLCPIMSQKMSQLQGRIPAGVSLVSFTVDPEHDTPAVLKAYGQRLHADFSRWHFLTGSHQQMAAASLAMKISVKAATPTAQLVHSDKFLLVDGDGNVVGLYSGVSDEDVRQLIADAASLVKRGGTLTASTAAGPLP